MRNLFLLMLLSLVSNYAKADWKYIGSDDTQKIYINPSSIIKKKGIAKMWTLFDFNEAHTTRTGLILRSFKRLNEFDCVNASERMIKVVPTEDNMGQGNVLEGEQPSGAEPFNPIIPDSGTELAFKYACGLKKISQQN